jgi:hypothetical protein
MCYIKMVVAGSLLIYMFYVIVYIQYDGKKMYARLSRPWLQRLSSAYGYLQRPDGSAPVADLEILLRVGQPK